MTGSDYRIQQPYPQRFQLAMPSAFSGQKIQKNKEKKKG